MKFLLPRFAACAPFVCAAPLFAASALAMDPAQDAAATAAPEATEPAATQMSAEAPAETSTAAPASQTAPAAPTPAEAPAAAEDPEEEARTCRNIRLDASSRRKSRVCLTQQGWRDLNNRR